MFSFMNSVTHCSICTKSPVLGREENAADTMSAMLMLLLAKGEARRLILGAAYWYTDDLETAITLKPSEFSAVHSTPHQRFFNLICIAYGAHQRCSPISSKRAICRKSVLKTANQNFSKPRTRSIS